MTADPDRMLSEFMDAWAAGRRPDVDDYLARVREEHRDELASLIHSYLSVAPTPDYDERTWDEIAGDPLVQRITQPELPPLLARLRGRVSLTVRQVAEAVAPHLGVEGREEKAARYLQRLEEGDLDPRGVSERVFGALGRVLHVPAAQLLDAARLSPAARPSAAFFRADAGAQAEAGGHLEILAQAMAAPAPAGTDWDEVDELFLGGP